MAIPEPARFPVTIEGETVYIGTASDLAVALDVLQGQHDRAVLAQLEPHLASVIAGPSGFVRTIKALAPADQVFLVQALGPHLGDLLGSAERLRDTLVVLAEPAVEECLLQALGAAGLRRLVQTPVELAEVLEWVYGDCDQTVLDLLGVDHLCRLFASGRELSLVLHSLDEERQTWLIDQIGWPTVARLPVNGARADVCWRTAESVYGGGNGRVKAGPRRRVPEWSAVVGALGAPPGAAANTVR